MPNCSSCGLTIPEGQGKSCSMCYGDIEYGRDGYAAAEWERQARYEQEQDEARRQEYESEAK